MINGDLSCSLAGKVFTHLVNKALPSTLFTELCDCSPVVVGVISGGSMESNAFCIRYLTHLTPGHAVASQDFPYV